MPEKEESNNHDTGCAPFSDVLSALITGVAHARASCDREVTQIAQLYKQDLFLQSFSVPRLRIDQVVIDIPVNVCGLQKSKTVEVASAEVISMRVEEAIKLLLADETMTKQYLGLISPSKKLTEALKQQHERQIDELLSAFETKKLDEIIKEIKIGLLRVRQKINRNKALSLCLSQLQVMIEIKEVLKRAFYEAFDCKDYALFTKDEQQACNISDDEQLVILKSKHISEIINYVSERAVYPSITQEELKSDVFVNVVTDEVKNKTTPGTLMRIQVKLAEEGMVWHNAKGEGCTEDRWNLTLE